ncbi:hypothetical protein [Staphylothermus hellenicus]|uniref:Uncharacterized protein n=1 Tax=Staphylothermus hellenicus (strain DSM 12710 / JCM 10830 / BK20S6-10-b1 / P8) TaxID=591019 RepID=D7D8W2_STAHD|nr:hypothetical protein [Staphylothermus hellenicus]ADI32208.1 hypothetical protein Shell_1105 [Staphylothermus hellenicus DSM 12710]
MSSDEELPFFADKSIVGDYSPLIKYWKILRKKGIPVEDALLAPRDFTYLKEQVEIQQKINLAVILEQLTNYFLNRIRCDVAKEAYREAYSVELSEEDTCRRLAKILAGWLIEASKNTGVIKLTYPWRKE